MEKQELIGNFIKKVEIESNYKKFLRPDLIKKIAAIYKQINLEEIEYKKDLDVCIELALEFYREYNYDYYLMIINGILNNEIQYIDYNSVSFVDTETNTACIKRFWNDSDVFVVVHEFAHYIDRKSNIIPDKYNFLAEVFSRFIERKLMEFLVKKGLGTLVNVRMNNMLYTDSVMLKAIEYQLHCEEIYKQNGKLTDDDLDIEKIKLVMGYSQSNLINYYLRYPIGTILSDYLINNDLVKSNTLFAKRCLETDLYDVSDDFARKLNIQ